MIEKLQGKHIIILESSDQGGKSSLSQYLQNNVEGKCHVLHSNYNPACSKQVHRRQHFLLNKFASKQFHNKYYTKNNVVIFDRNYISDIIYGKIGLGSKGSEKYKLKTLGRLFKILRKKNKDVKISLIYCRPEKFSFSEDKKEELLDSKQNQVIRDFYDEFFNSCELLTMLFKYNIAYYRYDYINDPDYTEITKKLNERKSIYAY